MNCFTSLTLVLLGLAAGCAGPTAGSLRRTQPLAQGGTPGPTEVTAADGMSGDAITASDRIFAPASALVFDLPIARDVPPLNLDRESRQPAAFVGFEGPSIEYHTLLINNCQSVGIDNGYGPCNLGDGYQRQDLIERTSVRYR